MASVNGVTRAFVMHDHRALALQHIDLAKRVARQMRARARQADPDEIQSAAYLGLVEAARTYRHEAGAFEAFAVSRIRGAVLDWMRLCDPLSREMRGHNNEIEATRADLAASLGREPVEMEIAGAMGLSLDAFQRRRARSLFPLRLSAHPADADRDIIAEMPCPRQNGEAWLTRRDAHRALAMLPRRLKQVARAYYLHDRLLSDIGAEHGVTESRASQLLLEARTHLRAKWAGGQPPAPKSRKRKKRRP